MICVGAIGEGGGLNYDPVASATLGISAEGESASSAEEVSSLTRPAGTRSFAKRSRKRPVSLNFDGFFSEVCKNMRFDYGDIEFALLESFFEKKLKREVIMFLGSLTI